MYMVKHLGYKYTACATYMTQGDVAMVSDRGSAGGIKWGGRHHLSEMALPLVSHVRT